MERTRLRPIPREHGASFMSAHALLLGLVAGFAAGGRSVAGLSLALAMGALFLPLAAAVSALSHRRLARAARRRMAWLGAAMAAAGLLALAVGPAPQLLALGGAGAALGTLYGAARAGAGPRSALAELAAIAGISLLAPAAWLLVAGPTPGWPLAGPVAFGSFGGTVPYVRERVRRRRTRPAGIAARLRGGAPALAWQGAALLLCSAAAAAGLVNVLVPVAFSPGAVKTAIGIARPETAPSMRRLGTVETVVSTAFAILAGLGLALGT
ncbi:MAG: YwiC-like family protein [Candidatus Velamenicoccus archaeovorus]